MSKNSNEWDDLVSRDGLQNARRPIQPAHTGGYGGNIEACEEQKPDYGHLKKRNEKWKLMRKLLR